MIVEEIKLNSIKAAGISARTNNADESDPGKSQIMPLYRKFFEEDIESKIPGVVNDEFFMGVYTDYESDYNGDYTLIICKEVADYDNIPEEFHKKEIEEGKYLRFSAEGEMPGVVFEAWKYIWEYFSNNSQYERAYNTDFEKYSKLRHDKVEIFISIK